MYRVTEWLQVEQGWFIANMQSLLPASSHCNGTLSWGICQLEFDD
jgi:hypothetical protein